MTLFRVFSPCRCHATGGERRGACKHAHVQDDAAQEMGGQVALAVWVVLVQGVLGFCEVGWREIDGKCYHLTTPLTFRESTAACGALGGSPATKPPDGALICTATAAWLGLSWDWFGMRWEWLTGQPGPALPTPMSTSEGCGMVTSTGYSGRACNDRLPVLCEKQAYPGHEGGILYERGYYSLSNETFAYAAASQYCELVSLSSFVQQIFVRDYFSCDAPFLVSAHRTTSGKWKWADGAYVSTGLWDVGFPIATHNCAVQASWGLRSINCAEPHKALCVVLSTETPIVPFPTPTLPTRTASLVPTPTGTLLVTETSSQTSTVRPPTRTRSFSHGGTTSTPTFVPHDASGTATLPVLPPPSLPVPTPRSTRPATPSPSRSTPLPTPTPSSSLPLAIPEQAVDGASPCPPPQAMQAMGVVAVVGLALAGGAAPGPTQLLLVASGCKGDVGWAGHPTGIEVWDDRDAGAVLGNLALMAGVGVVAVLFNWCGVDIAVSMAACVWMWLYQATVFSAFRLFQYSEVWLWGLGLSCVVLCITLPGWVGYVSWCGVPQLARYREETREGDHPIQSILGKGEWVNVDARNRFLTRYGSVLRPYREQWCVYFLVDMLTMLLLAATGSYPESCEVVLVSWAAVCLISAASMAWHLPHARKCESFIRAGALLLICVAAIFNLEGLDPLPLLYAAMALLMIQMCLALTAEVYTWRSGRRSRLQMLEQTEQFERQVTDMESEGTGDELTAYQAYPEVPLTPLPRKSTSSLVSTPTMNSPSFVGTVAL
eukprot:Sspe_Gene.17298::Locus_6136_Transcript_1_1_Confidence_1.000_Length_3427::g.17298::m.17298